MNRFRNSFLFSSMPLDGVEGLIADDMLDLAGVFRGGFFADTQAYEHFCQHRVALEDLLRGGKAGFGQGQVAVFVRFHIAALLQKSHGAANAGFGEDPVSLSKFLSIPGQFLSQKEVQDYFDHPPHLDKNPPMLPDDLSRAMQKLPYPLN